jgi:methylated-DNA-[protein]-cysteine S-methyltransferase
MSTQIYIKLKKAQLNKTITELQYKIYIELLKIPAGKVTTYKQIAKQVKCNSPRAIGQALKKNPYAPDVPCHRVVKSNLSLGGFAGSFEDDKVSKKLKLLISEGVELTESKKGPKHEHKVNETSLWNWQLNT